MQYDCDELFYIVDGMDKYYFEVFEFGVVDRLAMGCILYGQKQIKE